MVLRVFHCSGNRNHVQYLFPTEDVPALGPWGDSVHEINELTERFRSTREV